MNQNRWILPEGIDELLPDDAAALEALRRQLCDFYKSWGYEYIIPPLIEYLDSLLTGTGHESDLQTFKLVDQLNGKTMGVRSDMTPQVARIDAHRLSSEGINRLCYFGTTLNTLPSHYSENRSPFQLGAEIYGHGGAESDVEVISLMLATLDQCTTKSIYLDLGHVGLFRGLAKYVGLTQDQENALFDMMQRKSIPEINRFVVDVGLSEKEQSLFTSLVHQSGDEKVLANAIELYSGISDDVSNALQELKGISEQLHIREPGLQIHFDLSELRGYSYHTGVVFTAFVENLGCEVARGGRYDNIGSCFGRSRPATGFSTDLKLLSLLFNEHNQYKKLNAIFVPDTSESSVWDKIKQLRAAGEVVVCALSESTPEPEIFHFDRELKLKNGQWVVE